MVCLLWMGITFSEIYLLVVQGVKTYLEYKMAMFIMYISYIYLLDHQKENTCMHSWMEWDLIFIMRDAYDWCTSLLLPRVKLSTPRCIMIQKTSRVRAQNVIAMSLVVINNTHADKCDLYEGCRKYIHVSAKSKNCTIKLGVPVAQCHGSKSVRLSTFACFMSDLETCEHKNMSY